MQGQQIEGDEQKGGHQRRKTNKGEEHNQRLEHYQSRDSVESKHGSIHIMGGAERVEEIVTTTLPVLPQLSFHLTDIQAIHACSQNILEGRNHERCQGHSIHSYLWSKLCL